MAVLIAPKRVLSALCPLFFYIFSILLSPSDLFAIHAIFKGAAPIPRQHGPVSLNMSLEAFLETVSGTEVEKAIGQFSDEHRFELDPSAFSDETEHVYSDFYNGHLFRIEISYQPRQQTASLIEALVSENAKLYGPPRINLLAGIRLFFWDDGATRMILQVDESDKSLEYSLTYIDDDLFHQASQNRVQRETGGRSSYGK